MRDLAPKDFESTIIKLLDLGSDSVEKLAPHADKLADLFIIYGLYQTGKDAGINPFWGPLSYRLATTPEENPGEISVGFGWGATQIQVPASTRMIGVLGLASMGLAISLSQLSESVRKGTGPGPEIPIEAYTPPPIPESDFKAIIEENTRITYIEVETGKGYDPYDPEGIYKSAEEPRYTINWDQIKNNLANLPKIGLFSINRRLQRFRELRGGWLLHPGQYTEISGARYEEILKALSADLEKAYEGQRKWMEIITGNAIANIYPGVNFKPEP